MKKLLCVFLVLLTILLVACTPTETNSNATSNTDVSISDTSSSTSTEYVSGLPSDLKFDGDEFIILSGYTHGIDPSVLRYFGGDPAEEVESNVVNDAAILRNNIVEDKLGIDIIERLHEMGVLEIILTGGEPISHPLFTEILDNTQCLL